MKNPYDPTEDIDPLSDLGLALSHTGYMPDETTLADYLLLFEGYIYSVKLFMQICPILPFFDDIVKLLKAGKAIELMPTELLAIKQLIYQFKSDQKQTSLDRLFNYLCTTTAGQLPNPATCSIMFRGETKLYQVKFTNWAYNADYQEIQKTFLRGGQAPFPYWQTIHSFNYLMRCLRERQLTNDKGYFYTDYLFPVIRRLLRPIS